MNHKNSDVFWGIGDGIWVIFIAMSLYPLYLIVHACFVEDPGMIWLEEGW